MKIYLAAPWAHRHTLPPLVAQIRAAGHTLTSRWHDQWAHVDSHDPVVMRGEAQYDLDDVREAETVLVLNLEKSEGKAVEQGYALALHIPIIVVGDTRFNVFQYLDTVRLVPDLPSALALLQ